MESDRTWEGSFGYMEEKEFVEPILDCLSVMEFCFAKFQHFTGLMWLERESWNMTSCEEFG